MCLCVFYVCVYICVYDMRCMWKPEDNLRSLLSPSIRHVLEIKLGILILSVAVTILYRNSFSAMDNPNEMVANILWAIPNSLPLFFS